MSAQPTSSFLRFALEIRQEIYRLALCSPEDTKDIIFTLDEDERLCNDGLPTLASLMRVNRQICAEVFDYIFSQCRFVLADEAKPCRYIIRAFIKQFKLVQREKIKRVYLSRFTFVGLEGADDLTVAFAKYIALQHPLHSQATMLQRYFSERPPPYDQSPYLLQLFQQVKLVDSRGNLLTTAHENMQKCCERLSSTVDQELNISMLLLAHSFPSLKMLDIGIDIRENCYADTWKTRTFMRLLGPINKLQTCKNIKELHVRIHWKNYVKMYWPLDHSLDDESLKAEFLGLFKNRIPVKEVTSVEDPEFTL